jgi:DNA-binding beta-propeller fold protein YncE
LWVTYYRRSYDKNAESPSAVAIIDTESDEIIRVMPTGPLPKMIACSPDNKSIAVTHWGDNTVGIIDVSSEDPMDFKYTKHCIVDYRAKLNFSSETHVNRDSKCGNCLRGTVYTPDGNFLIVGKMGGSGGIMIFDTRDYSSLGTVKGMKNNVRHLVINNEYLYLSTNVSATVQKCNWKEVVKYRLENEGKSVVYTDWVNAHVGVGARTISITDDGEYVFAAVNNECKIRAVRTSDMEVVATISADSYPVGMALSPDEKHLIVTSQGKKSGGGNSVMIFNITRKSE